MQRAKGRGQKSEGRDRRTEDRGWRTEVGGQSSKSSLDRIYVILRIFFAFLPSGRVSRQPFRAGGSISRKPEGITAKNFINLRKIKPKNKSNQSS